MQIFVVGGLYSLPLLVLQTDLAGNLAPHVVADEFPILVNNLANSGTTHALHDFTCLALTAKTIAKVHERIANVALTNFSDFLFHKYILLNGYYSGFNICLLCTLLPPQRR